MCRISTDQNGHITVDGDIVHGTVGPLLDRRERTSLGIHFVSSIKPLKLGLNKNNNTCIYILSILKLHCIFKFLYTAKIFIPN